MFGIRARFILFFKRVGEPGKGFWSYNKGTPNVFGMGTFDVYEKEVI